MYFSEYFSKSCGVKIARPRVENLHRVASGADFRVQIFDDRIRQSLQKPVGGFGFVVNKTLDNVEIFRAFALDHITRASVHGEPEKPIKGTRPLSFSFVILTACIT